jgi:hypothetical protein
MLGAIWICTLSHSAAQSVTNGSFETPALPPNSFSYDPSGATWAFIANSGIINAPGDGFFGPPAPDGSQYAFLQTSPDGMFSQSISFTLAGTYELSYSVAGRSGNGFGAAGNLAYEVLLDSTPIASDSTTTGQPFTNRSFDFAAGAGNHTLTFQALPSANGGDDTAFFDMVGVQQVPEPTVAALLITSIPALLLTCAMTRRH